MYLKDAIRPNVGLELYSVVSPIGEPTWLNLEVAIFAKIDSSEVESRMSSRPAANTWFFVGGTQGGAFDAINVVSDSRIRFLQTAVGKRHPFRLDMIASMLQRLCVFHLC